MEIHRVGDSLGRYINSKVLLPAMSSGFFKIFLEHLGPRVAASTDLTRVTQTFTMP